MRLSESEMKIMDVLWKEKKPMTSDQIESQLDGWYKVQVYVWLSSLLDKEIIRYDGMIYDHLGNKVRSLSPAMTKDECMNKQ